MDGDANEQVVDVSHTLDAENRLRQQATVVLANPLAPIDDLKPILSAFNNRSVFRKKERAVASWLILNANWSDDQRITISETLSTRVERAMQTRKPHRAVLRWFFRGMVLSLIFWIGFDLLSPHSYSSVGIFDYWLGLLTLSAILTVTGSCFSLPLSVWIDNRAVRHLCPVVEALGRLGQPASIASIAKAFMQPSLRAVAAPALVRVAGRLRPDDYGALPVQSVPALCRALSRADPSTALVILQALTVIGDGRAIGAVDQIAHNGALSPEIRETATLLLPILQQRALADQTSSTLLRASNASQDGEQTLLRAVREQPVKNQSQLLRTVTEAKDGDQPR